MPPSPAARRAMWRATCSPSPRGSRWRHRCGAHGRSEAHFLEALDEIVASGSTNAEDLLALYHGDWHGDITRVFRDFAF